MPRPPPTSTLFPYTTLFRSASANELRGHRPRQRIHRETHQLEPQGRRRRTAATGVVRVRHLLVADDRDRKSTRLNSSHSQISYAVFCLKKKKKLHKRQDRHN